MPIKLKKSIYIGLGGTGVSVLLKIKKCFIDSYGEIPPMIGFLAIDTDSAASNKSETSNRGVNIKLDTNELLVCTVRGAVGVYQTNPNSYDWVPTNNVDKLSSIVGCGAGQVRSNGRFIAYYNNERIKSNIQAVVTKIHQLLPANSPYEVDHNRDGVEYPANINVFASVAGGTGSGMLVDVLGIICEALNQNSQAFKLYPWIVLPEIFRAMNQGPSMANVLYNSYGAIRTLDYIMHHNPKDPAINFGYTKINEPLFDYAYIINNTNKAGVTFNKIEDLIDVVAKSAFLPANKMGDDLSSPFDNIVAQKMGGAYDILNKKAWAASASSAELIYDSQAVGRARAYTIINQLCDSMLQSHSDGSSDANKFFDDQNVMIRENNGRDDIIDALLSPAPEYTLQIDENTTVFDINCYIDNNTGQTVLEPNIKSALDKKLTNTQRYFETYIAQILARPQGKVDAAIKFINALLNITAICKSEMEQEGNEFHRFNAVPEQWDVFVNAVKNKGIKSLLSKTNEDAIEILQTKLRETVTNHREEIRRSWAIKFYNSFEEILNNKLIQINGLKSYLQQIRNNSTNKLLAEQQEASSKSKFQIFLHEDDVRDSSNIKIDDTLKTAFVQYLGNTGVASWIEQPLSYIDKKLWDFAKGTGTVKDAVNTDIDSVLGALQEDQVNSYLDRLKLLASPLWTYNPQGYNHQDLKLDRFVVVGVGNRDTSILSTNPAFNTHFDTNGNKTSFASTNQHDRVYILVVEDLLPIYAVNNFSSYQHDHDEKVFNGFMMSNYLDEKLNNRINSENFSVMPTVETDNVLQYWVWGFIFGHIHFDNEKGVYWMRSRKKGDALRKYRLDLNAHRDVAYDLFKSEKLYKEVEDALNREIGRTGRQPIEDRLTSIKAADSYLEEYAQLSPLEQSNLNDPNFRSIRDLLADEINLMSD
jgi:hypothetical protein